MLIGLMGYKYAGKDTVGAYLVEKHGFERLAFADLMKLSLSKLLGISIEAIDHWKNDPDVTVQIVRQPHKDAYPMTLKSMTFLEFVQHYGTRSHRDVFGGYFWVDLILPEPVAYGQDADLWHRGKKFVVTDVRFKEEVARIQEMNGYLVKIYRDSVGRTSDHLSEDLPGEAFYTLNNYAGFDELYTQVEDLLLYIEEHGPIIHRPQT